MSGKCFLNAGESLFKGEQLTTLNKEYCFVFQYDGNIVLYNGSKLVWSSNTLFKEATELKLELNGHLVLYEDQKELWTYGTQTSGAVIALFQDNGDVGFWNKDHVQVDRFGTGLSMKEIGMEHDKIPISCVLPQHGSLLSMYHAASLQVNFDGTVHIKVNEEVKWKTDDIGARFLVLQNDGNFVIYNENSEAVWASNTMGSGAQACMLLENGNLVLVDDEKTTNENIGDHLLETVVAIPE